jgi:hypothetical protein
MDRDITVANQTFTAHELSSLVLKSLKNDAESYLGEAVNDAVITVPAYFHDHQRQATVCLDCDKNAKSPNENLPTKTKFINEPSRMRQLELARK